MDLEGEPTRVAGRRCVLVGPQRKGVDLLARQLISISHVLGRFDHLHIGIARQECRIGRAAGTGPHGVE